MLFLSAVEQGDFWVVSDYLVVDAGLGFLLQGLGRLIPVRACRTRLSGADG